MERKQEIVISTGLQTQKLPQLSANGTFYAIYSPIIFKLRPCKSIMLDLQLKIKLLDGVQGIIGLLPSFNSTIINYGKQQIHNIANTR